MGSAGSNRDIQTSIEQVRSGDARALARAISILAAMLTAALTLAVDKAAVPRPEHEVLRGRVIADVASLAFGAGLRPQWVSFIFAVETSSRKVIPVRISYAFYKNEQLPPDSFWDYSTLDDLDVKRDPKCDTTVKAISPEKNVDEHGNELPATYIFRSGKNAPANLLKPETPCRATCCGMANTGRSILFRPITDEGFPFHSL